MIIMAPLPRPRIVRTLLATLAALGTLLASGPPAGAQTPPADRTGGEVRPHLIDGELRHTLTTAAAGEQINYLVSLTAAPDLSSVRFDRAKVVAELRAHADRTQRSLVDHLRSQGAQVRNTFWLANLVLVRSDAHTAVELTARADVAQLLPVQTLQVPDTGPEGGAHGDHEGGSVATVEDRTWGIDRIAAHRVWDELGPDGSGVRVAVLDTGVNPLHPDLASRLATDDPDDPHYPGGWMAWDPDGRPVANTPRDTQRHGTHVSGTVVGGAASGTHIGVAPGAELMHGLVLPGGSGTTPQVLAGMQWAIDPYDQAGAPAGTPAKVVNMSFGPALGGINDLFAAPVRNMYLAGVLPVAAAGNCGDGCHGTPGNVYEALSVGATDATDDVAGFSSGGDVAAADWADPPADWPVHWTVPEVSAPGVDVLSSVPAAFGPPYGTASGTSMAAPHVAGLAALMLSADPQLDPDALREAMVDTSFFDERHGQARPNSRYGHGRVDAFQSVSRVMLHSGVSGEVVDAGTGAPVDGVRVELVEAGMSMRTTADGTFEFRLPPGEYSLHLSWSGREVATVDGVIVDDSVIPVRVPLAGVAGTVTDADTALPLADAAVTVAGTGVATTTVRDGSYRLYLRPGAYEVAADAFGYDGTGVAGVTVTDGAITRVDPQLPPLPTGTVTGTVSYTDSGFGVPGVTVELAGGRRSATTDADGVYTIEDAPVGQHDLRARPDVFIEPDPVEVTVSDGEELTVDITLDCHAQCAGMWVSRYRGPAGGLDSPAAVAISPDGSRGFVTGSSTGVGTDQDYATVAYDTATGQQVWQARYDGPASSQDGANAITVSPDGEQVFVTGLALGRGVTGSGADYATVAYDAVTGDELWVARYNGPGDDFDNARAVEVSPDGSQVFVTGQSRAGGTPAHTEYATVAYDTADGTERWVARYNGPSSDFDSAHDLAVSPDGSRVFVTGQSPGEGGQSSSQGSGWDYATVAYDAAHGEQLWVARYDGPANALDHARAIAVSPDGSRVVVTGRSNGVGTGDDYAAVAYDPADGSELWVGRYDGPGNNLDVAAAVTVSPDSDTVYVTGESRSGTAPATADYATVAFDAAHGAQQWVARYNGPGDGLDRAQDVVVSPDGSRVVVTGASGGDGTDADFATVAYEPDTGEQQWVARFDGPASDADRGAGAAFSPDSARVFVTGSSALGIGDDPLVAPREYVTVAYDADGTKRSPVFVAHDLQVTPAVAMPGTPVRVAVSVTNVGTGAGSYGAALVVDGATEQSTVVTLDPGERTDLAWDLDAGDPGQLEVRVEHATAALTVAACDTSITGTHDGPLPVVEGTVCLVAGSEVRGPVTVAPGAGLVGHGATVTGPIDSDGAAMIDLRHLTVTGGLTVAGSTGHVHISGSEVRGPVVLESNLTAPAAPVLAGNRITGSLWCEGNQPPPVDNGDPNEVTGRVSGQCDDSRG